MHMDPELLAASPQGARLQLPPLDVVRRTLPNGLEIIVQEDHSAPVVSVQLWVQTGSIHEGTAMGAGISHMLEHMLFKGTTTLSACEFAQRVQDQGGYINAYTSFDRTVYWIDIPAKGAEVALDLLTDAALHSTLPPEEFIKEQEVIRREFAMGNDDPDRVSSTALFANAYREHPYRYPIIGHLDVFNTITREDVMAYYKARYVPNNMFFVVTGDVDAAAVFRRLESLFATTPRAALPPVYLPEEPRQLGRRELHAEFPTELTRLHMAWHVPGTAHADVPALDVLAMIVGHGRSARLYRSIREDKGLAHSVDAWCYAPAQGGLFGVDAMCDPQQRAPIEAEVLRILQEIEHSGVTDAELQKAKRQSLSTQLQAVTTMRGKASDLGSNWLLARSLDFSRDYLRAVEQVDDAAIRAVVSRYLRDSNLTIVSLNPPGAAHPPAVASAVSRAGEIQRFELSNGLRLLVREDPRLPLVSVATAFQAGLLAETAENNGITRLLARVMHKGTAKRTAEQISDEIESMGGGISTDAGNNSLSAFIRVLRPDLKAGLDILADVLCHASLPEKAIAREKEVQLAGIKAEDEEMTSVARTLLRSELMKNHPYGLRGSGTPESVARLTRDDLAAFRDRAVTARNGVISVFGDVKAEEVRALVEQALGKLPAGERAFAKVPQPAPLPSAVTVERNRDKQQAILMVGFLGADIYSKDRAALDLIDEASSDLGSRFFLRIREQLGLAYFVGSSNMLGLVPGPFVFYLGTDPMKLTAVQAELMDEIRLLAREGLTPSELARAKEKLLGQREIRNQSNDSFAFATALDELYGLGFDHYKKTRAEVEAVTLADIKHVANQYFLHQPALTAIVRPKVEA
jgi:zinc protease